MTGKCVLVTGASSGIGRATVQFFASKGWNVAATMRNPAKDASWPAAAAPIRLDVTDIASIEEALAAAKARFGQIDAVVNNAGYGAVGPFEASTPDAVDRQLATNVIGLMNVVRAILPDFRARREGVIVNVASMGGRITFPLYSVYHASKWAVEGFSESLQYELNDFNIRVKLIEPGPIKTDFYNRSMDLFSRPGLTAYDAFVARAMPNMQAAGERAPGPEAVAKTIFRAVTDGSRKLRYPVNAAGILALRKLLPDSLFTSVVKAAVLK